MVTSNKHWNVVSIGATLVTVTYLASLGIGLAYHALDFKEFGALALPVVTPWLTLLSHFLNKE